MSLIVNSYATPAGIGVPMYGCAPGSLSGTQTIYYWGSSFSDFWTPSQAGFIVGLFGATQTPSTSGTITLVPYTSGALSAAQLVFTLSATVTGNLYGYADLTASPIALSVGTGYRMAAYYQNGSPSGTVQAWMAVKYS